MKNFKRAWTGVQALFFWRRKSARFWKSCRFEGNGGD